MAWSSWGIQMANGSSDEQLELTRGIYDYLCRVRDEQASNYRSSIDKTHKVMTFHIVLVAAMGFGLTRLEWLRDHKMWAIPVAAAGITATAYIGRALFLALRSIQIDEANVVGVDHLRELLRSGDALKLRPYEAWSDLGQNLAAVIQKDHGRFEQRGKVGRSLNRTTAWGYLWVAIFVLFATIGNQLSSLTMDQYHHGRRSVQQTERPANTERYRPRSANIGRAAEDRNKDRTNQLGRRGKNHGRVASGKKANE